MEKSKFILIAEDDIDDRFLLKVAFEENHFSERLCFVENGIELLDFLLQELSHGERAHMPEFILLDMNMPKKDGHEALNEIKQLQALKKIPIIIFSTTGNEHEMKRCYELGASAYITKPNSFESLITTVADIKATALNLIAS